MKRYTIAAFVLMALVWLFVSNSVPGGSGSTSIDLFSIPLPSFSIAFWVVVPLFILYVASVAHFSFYSLLGNFKLRKYEKDYEKIIDSIADAYLSKENRNHSFKTDRYRLLGSLIDNTTLFPNTSIVTTDAKISTILEVIEKIKNGEVVDLKSYALKSNNPLVTQNNRNRYKSGVLSAEDVLSHSSEYTNELCQEVYEELITNSPLYAIEQYKEFITKSSLYKILARINAPENTLEISNETIILLLEKLTLDTKEYINISLALSNNMIPEQRIKLFETLSVNNDEIMDAYLFTLFDLEMVSLANEILSISQQDEFIKFKAYAALKECNKNFNINLFI